MSPLFLLWLWSPAYRETSAGDPREAWPAPRVEALCLGALGALAALVIMFLLLVGGAR